MSVNFLKRVRTNSKCVIYLQDLAVQQRVWEIRNVQSGQQESLHHSSDLRSPFSFPRRGTQFLSSKDISGTKSIHVRAAT